MATKRLGENQKLDELFKRVLDKPDHENKVHEFGEFAFMFSKTTWFVRTGHFGTEPVNGYLFTVFRKAVAFDQLSNNKTKEFEYLNCIIKHKPTTTLASIVSRLASVVKSNGVAGMMFSESRQPFKEQFTKYLNYLELNEKLQDKTEKRTTMKI